MDQKKFPADQMKEYYDIEGISYILTSKEEREALTTFIESKNICTESIEFLAESYRNAFIMHDNDYDGQEYLFKWNDGIGGEYYAIEWEYETK